MHRDSFICATSFAQIKGCVTWHDSFVCATCATCNITDVLNCTQPWSNAPFKSEGRAPFNAPNEARAGSTGSTYDLDGYDAPKKMFNMCADKFVDIVVGPGGYQTNKQFYPMKVNSTYDVREYGIAMMEEREGAPLGCNDGVSTSNR